MTLWLSELVLGKEACTGTGYRKCLCNYSISRVKVCMIEKFLNHVDDNIYCTCMKLVQGMWFVISYNCRQD